MPETDINQLIANLKASPLRFWVSPIQAARDLKALGPAAAAAVPAMAQTIAKAAASICSASKRELATEILSSLGQLGPAARPAVPAIIALAKSAEDALQAALGQVASTPGADILAKTMASGVDAEAALSIMGLGGDCADALGRVTGQQFDYRENKGILRTWWESTGRHENWSRPGDSTAPPPSS